MFKELEPLLPKRSLTITVAALAAGQIRVNVIPHSRPEDTRSTSRSNTRIKTKLLEFRIRRSRLSQLPFL